VVGTIKVKKKRNYLEIGIGIGKLVGMNGE